MQPPALTRSDRTWINRWLELTTESLKELQFMRLEAEERVRGALEEEHRNPRHKGDRIKWHRRCTEDAYKRTDLDRAVPCSSPFESIQEEVLGRLSACTLENCIEMFPPEDHHSPPSGCSQQDLVQGLLEGSPIRKLAECNVESVRPARTNSAQTQENLTDHSHPLRRQYQAPADSAISNNPWVCQSPTTEGHNLAAQNVGETFEQSKDQEPLLLVVPTETTFLRRMGSGSLAPRPRLGSSGVTSDLLFTRRKSGNCMSAHSSGFYETSDLDSTSSSCSSRSSLCSSSCHSSVSLMSPHRSSVMRPRSIDCTMERRMELQSGTAQTKRPMSAGTLDGFLRLASNSQYDLTQTFDVAVCNHPFTGTSPLIAIKQRQKAEQYICKLALKYRCKPGMSTVCPDLGPPTPRYPAHAFSSVSCPPSPQVTSLSSSMVDVRKNSSGSWRRFLSHIIVKRDSRIAASMINLEQCGKSLEDNLQSQSLTGGHFIRAKSFRDLLAVNPFKRNLRGLNKAW
ncbi:uncharacterized protein [Dendropsophus ebraccatus]|uniref:uncharacterized protein isoform X2 n=1 Tax=Dendropsophus ebraccatus TaxID=150705 RepID=UPI0038322AA4